MNIPTSDLEMFKKQLSTPNVGYSDVKQEVKDLSKEIKGKVKKHMVLSFLSDYTGCGHIRNILPTMYLNAIYGKGNNFNVVTSPVMIHQEDMLQRTRSVFFQRTMGPQTPKMVEYYKSLQEKYKFKMVYDIDDFIWDGGEDGEEIPEYNFGKHNITKEVQESSIINMKMMDTVCVTTPFLRDYIASKGVDKDRIQIVHNTLPSFLWGADKKPYITEKIKKPTILWSASPTHWHNQRKLYGDMDNVWREWIIKNVKAGRINYVQMGGCPWFFDEIKNDIKVIEWVNSIHYPRTVKSIGADFGIAPLVPNYFNYSKSAIKYQEYCVSGIVGVGTVFSNGQPSPYDIAVTKAQDTITMDELDFMFFEQLSQPENYNRILDQQYAQVIENDWITESHGYVKLLTSIL